MNIAVIAAVDEGGIIGSEGHLPWHLPEDLKRFKRLTLGHPIIMGRRTFASIGKPLPGRSNTVLSRNPAWIPPAGVQLCATLADALNLARAAGASAAFLIGGSEVFSAGLPLAHRVHLTRVHARHPGDARFPDFPTPAWRLVHEEHHPRDEKHACAFSFLDYERKNGGRLSEVLAGGNRSEIGTLPLPLGEGRG